MIENGPCDKKSSEIPFCDETTETADTIRIFPELSSVKLSPDHFGNHASSLVRAVPFLIKYDCQWPIRVLQVQISEALDVSRIEPLAAFEIASLLDSPALAEIVVRRHGTAYMRLDTYSSLYIKCKQCFCSSDSNGLHQHGDRGRVKLPCGRFKCSVCGCFSDQGPELPSATDMPPFSRIPGEYMGALWAANRATAFNASQTIAASTFSSVLRDLRKSEVRVWEFIVADGKKKQGGEE